MLRFGVPVAVAAGVIALVGASAASAEITALSPPAVTGSPVVGQTLTTSTGTWPGDNRSYGFWFQWYRCSLPDGTLCEGIIGATQSTYRVTASDIGWMLSSTVTAYSGNDSGSADSPPTAVVTAPIVPDPPSNVADMTHGVSASDLANALVGDTTGVSISNVAFTGSPRAAGTFTNTYTGQQGIGFAGGIVLSTGHVETHAGDVTQPSTTEPCTKGVEAPNACHEATAVFSIGSETSSDLGLAGDPTLSGIVGTDTRDAAVLQFDFVPKYPTIQFRYVFGSEEYNDYANSQFNDVFGFFVNGQNCALVPGTNQPVSVDTINNGNPDGDTTPHNPQYYRDNVRPVPTIQTELDGLTTVLTCTAHVDAGTTNHLELAIADTSDAYLDSAVFLEAGSLVSGQTTLSTSLSATSVQAGDGVTDTATVGGLNATSATGTVTYSVYSDSRCTDRVTTAGTTNVTNGTAAPSDPVTLDEPGTYYWQALYSGDDANQPSLSTCGDEVETVTVPSRAISVADASATEGSPLTFTLTLDKPAVLPITVVYATSDGTASADDYTAASGTASFAAGATSATVTVPTANDSLDENDETLTLTLSSPTNASLANESATGTIVDDDPPPTISIADARVQEGDTGATPATFSVSLSTPSGKTVNVGWSTADGTASAGSDYTASSGTLTFAPGETSKTITVDVLGDTLVEGNEAFTVALSTGATATGTIVDDDNHPPTCDAAAATPNTLWSPNGKFVTVAVGGCTDADHDPLTYTITKVEQDEARGTAPDARRVAGHPNEVQLRAERLGTGNGRVYVITFTVSDGKATVTGTARVTVPHDQSHAAVDSRIRVDSGL